MSDHDQDHSTASAAEEWKPGVNPWIIAASVMAATFMVVLDTSVANVALPHIAGSLSASTDESTWVLTSYLVSNAIVLPATGWISNYIGRRRFLIASIVIFTAASALCGASASMLMLIVARVIQGAGGGGMQPIAQAVLLESFPPRKRGLSMAVYGMGVVVAPIIGPTLGGWITDNYSWRWVFYINLPVGIIAILMALTFIEDPPYIKRALKSRIDLIGFGFMALGLAALQLVLDQGQEADWLSSNWIVWCILVSAAAIVAFVIRELSVEHPIVNLRVLKDRNFTIGTGAAGAYGAVLYATTALLPLFLQTLLEYPAVDSGLAVSPRGIGALISMMLVGRLVSLVDGRILVGIGFAVLAYATYQLGDINLSVSMASVVWPNLLSGLAMGFVFVPITTIAMGTLRQNQMGNATGIYNLVRNLGGSFGIAVVTTLLARRAQVHQQVMASHLTPFDPAFSHRLQDFQGAIAPQLGSVAASHTAIGTMYAIVTKQAALMAFIDNFHLLAALSLICVPAAIALKAVHAGAKAHSVME